MKKLIILVLVSLLVGCSGVDTLRINTVPEQAKLYVNGEYAGLTPCAVPADWYRVLGIPVGSRVHLTIAKEGYKTVEKDVPLSERGSRKQGGGYVSGSPFDLQATSLHTFTLEPLQNN
jgi:hypothetical protein